MTMAAADYFRHLRAYLASDYIVDDGTSEKLTLVENYFAADSTKPLTRKVQFGFAGEAFVFNLDRKEKSENRRSDISPKLFHFLEDTGQPWSKKCDFVIFQRHGRTIIAYCIEFKSDGVNVDNIAKQLKAGVCWVQSLKRVIEHYCDVRHAIKVQKFVFCSRDDVSPYVDADGKYLVREPSIRLYRYADLDEISLEQLDNTSVVRV